MLETGIHVVYRKYDYLNTLYAIWCLVLGE